MASALRIALTFDDLPVHGALPSKMTWRSIHRALVASIRGAKIPPVIGFINGINIKTRDHTEAISVWLHGGQKIGNHTFSHFRPHEHGPHAYLSDIRRNELLLKSMYGLVKPAQRERLFRYPCLDEGQTLPVRDYIRQSLLLEDYAPLPVHISFHDWRWNEYYLRCTKAEAFIAARHVEDAFIAWSRRTVAYFAAGRPYGLCPPICIVALHVGALEAQCLGRWLHALQSDGAEFVDAEEAIVQPEASPEQKAFAQRAPAMPIAYLDEMVAAAPQRPPAPRYRGLVANAPV